MYTNLLAEDHLDDAVKLTINNYPTELYKIFPPELSRIEALWDDGVWFSDPNKFDDPFDTGHWHSIYLSFESIIKELTPEQRKHIDTAKIQHVFEDRTSKLRKDIKQQYIVSCFMERVDSSVLWSQYGQSQRGFAIQIDLSPKSLLDLDYSIWPVSYTKDLFDLSDAALHTPNTFQYRLLLTKGDEWAYQDEWRAIKKAHNI